MFWSVKSRTVKAEVAVVIVPQFLLGHVASTGRSDLRPLLWEQVTYALFLDEKRNSSRFSSLKEQKFSQQNVSGVAFVYLSPVELGCLVSVESNDKYRWVLRVCLLFFFLFNN